MKVLAMIGGAVLALSATSVCAQESTWGAFARDTQRVYLIDTATLKREGDVATASIARVRRAGEAGDYSHVVDVFEIQCDGRQSRLLSSTDVEADGVTGDTFDEPEPWAAIREGAFDAQIRDMTCGDQVPAGTAFASIKAYIDAGRP